MKIPIVLLFITVCFFAASEVRAFSIKGTKVNPQAADTNSVIIYQRFVKLLLNDAWRMFNVIRYGVDAVKKTVNVLSISKEEIWNCFKYKEIEEAKVCAREELRKAHLQFEAIRVEAEKA